jgi:1-acyl-sn-glycerol-3-phosphate acyltransferase
MVMSEEGVRIRCSATTKAGSQCKNYALEGSEYCRVHQPSDENEYLLEERTREEQGPETTREWGEVIGEPEEQNLRRQLMNELDQLIERIRALTPGYSPPPFSPRRLLKLISENMENMSPDISLGIVERLRSSVSQDLFDVDTWKGIWYMLNYTLEYQQDILRRRITGDYETDEWGLDMEVVEAVKPFLDFLYYKYWRVETSGLENIPEEGRVLLVVNHSGQLPWDGAMLGTAVYNEHPSQRLVRTLYADWFPTLPFISILLNKTGQALANEANGTRLLEQEQIVSVFPEGIKGVGKLFKDRYKLARFGRGGFVRMALRTGAPIIPVAVVGAEETYVSLAKSPFIAGILGLPFFPISITWPWLGPLGFVPLPTKWYIDIGEPIPMDSYGSDAVSNLVLISQLTDQVRNIIQDMIYIRLAQRKSVFLG